MTDTWRKLAAMTGPCPGSPEFGLCDEGQICPRDNEWSNCPTCHGTNQVPLIEGLRQPCEKCRGTGTRYHPRFGLQLLKLGMAPRYPKAEDAYPCPNCGGTGWLLVGENRAIVAAQAFILSQPDPHGPGHHWRYEAEHEDDSYNIMISVWDTTADDWRVFATATQPTYAAALAQALERALEQEKP